MKKLFMFFLCLFILTGCSGGTVEPNYLANGYTVTVNYFMGEGTWRGRNEAVFQYKPNSPVAQIGIDFAKGETPELVGHTLDGWYLDEEFTQKFDFANTLTVDGQTINLYAKWVPNISYTYQVIAFDDNNQEIVVDEINTGVGQVFEKILVRRDDYIVLGYFQDKECQIPWDDSHVMREALEGETKVIEKVYSTWLPDTFEIVSTPEGFNKALTRGKDIYLQADLDFSNKNMSYSSSYSGQIIGNGHTISNISLNSLDELASDKRPQFGFFGTLYGATIKDLKIENVNIYVETKIQVEIYIGTLAGTIINSTIENVSISGNLTISETQDKINLLEYNITDLGNTIENSEINNCSVNFTVEDLRK